MKNEPDGYLYYIAGLGMTIILLLAYLLGRTLQDSTDRITALESRPPCPCSLEQEPEEEAVLDLPRFPKGRVR